MAYIFTKPFKGHKEGDIIQNPGSGLVRAGKQFRFLKEIPDEDAERLAAKQAEADRIAEEARSRALKGPSEEEKAAALETKKNELKGLRSAVTRAQNAVNAEPANEALKASLVEAQEKVAAAELELEELTKGQG